MSRTIGIDLGTTNSCVAVMEGGEPVIIPNAEGGRTTPSVVAFSKTGERMVGQIAKRQAVTNHDRTISSIKREMGSDYKVNVDGKAYTPQEISAMILQKLKSDAEAYLGQTVSEAMLDEIQAALLDVGEHLVEEAERHRGPVVADGGDRVAKTPAAVRHMVKISFFIKYPKFNFYLSYLVSSYLFRLSSIIRSPLAVEIPRKKLLIICTKASRSVIPAGSISSLRATSAEAV